MWSSLRDILDSLIGFLTCNLNPWFVWKYFRFCTTGLPSDITVEVGDMSFHLHKVIFIWSHYEFTWFNYISSLLLPVYLSEKEKKRFSLMSTECIIFSHWDDLHECWNIAFLFVEGEVIDLPMFGQLNCLYCRNCLKLMILYDRVISASFLKQRLLVGDFTFLNCKRLCKFSYVHLCNTLC